MTTEAKIPTTVLEGTILPSPNDDNIWMMQNNDPDLYTEIFKFGGRRVRITIEDISQRSIT